jgi:hypothetical protein
LKAASLYYSALEMVPEFVEARSVPYEEAQRMARVSTEYLLFATLHKGLVLRNLPESEHRLRRTKAVRVGKNALRGRGDSTEAMRLLREVLVIFPEDRQVQALVSELSGE